MVKTAANRETFCKFSSLFYISSLKSRFFQLINFTHTGSKKAIIKLGIDIYNILRKILKYISSF